MFSSTSTLTILAIGMGLTLVLYLLLVGVFAVLEVQFSDPASHRWVLGVIFGIGLVALAVIGLISICTNKEEKP